MQPLCARVRLQVRIAVELHSCQDYAITLHQLREVLHLLQSKITSPARCHGSRYSCSGAELASLLCFDPTSERAGEVLLTELKAAWVHVEAPRPQHDQLQMRVVQWLFFWVRGCDITALGRLASLVRAARARCPIARHAPRNASGPRELRRKNCPSSCLSSSAWDCTPQIAETARGVLVGRPAEQPVAADAPGFPRRALQSKVPVLLLTHCSASTVTILANSLQPPAPPPCAPTLRPHTYSQAPSPFLPLPPPPRPGGGTHG